MFSRDDRRASRDDRPRRRPNRVAVEGLEERQMMAYSPFGYSLPQLSVTGFAAPTAAYGGSLAVDVTVENQGASTLIEPTHLTPGSPSNADSPATTVQVYGAPRPNANTGLVLLGTIAIPAISQNGDFETVSTITLPTSKPAGFPTNGGKVYLTLVVDNSQTILQETATQNIYRVPTPVTIRNALPDLQVVGFDVPSTLQPGDVITPTIRIANLGSANTNSQGPVTVDLIASLNTTYGPGDVVVGSFTITNLPGQNGVPTQGSIANDANLLTPPNELTVTLAPIKLPTTPGFYYLGVKIDPNSKIHQTYAPNASLSDIVPVGPRSPYFTSANQLGNNGGALPVFPAKPSTIINPVTTTVGKPVQFPTLPPDEPFLAASTVSARSIKLKKSGKK